MSLFSTSELKTTNKAFVFSHCACIFCSLQAIELDRGHGCMIIALYLSVNVFSRKVLIGDTIFTSGLVETGPPFYVVIRATQRSTRLQGKGSTFISQLF